MFKVGDIIVGLPSSDEEYTITNKENDAVLEVVRVTDIGKIFVKIISTNLPGGSFFEGSMPFMVDSKHFTWKDMQWEND